MFDPEIKPMVVRDESGVVTGLVYCPYIPDCFKEVKDDKSKRTNGTDG
jgi:hypothetical protein